MTKAPAKTLGNVVVPARNGYLAQLGFDIEALDLKALGVILEDSGSRSLVSFPELATTVWLDSDEYADVFRRAEAGETDYAALLPEGEVLAEEPLVWILSHLIKTLPVVQVLGVDHGDLVELWDPADNESLGDFLSEDSADIRCCRVALGVSSFSPQLQKDIEKELGRKLLFLQLKPAGMHKFEVAFYLRVASAL